MGEILELRWRHADFTSRAVTLFRAKNGAANDSGEQSVAGFRGGIEVRTFLKNGGPCRGRTYGPLIKSQLLYQLS